MYKRQAEQAGYPKGCIPIMPVADHEAVGGAREAVVDADVWKYACLLYTSV